MTTATAPAFIGPGGMAVYLEELPPLKGIRFFDVTCYDSDGVEVAKFPSQSEGVLRALAQVLKWELAPGYVL